MSEQCAIPEYAETTITVFVTSSEAGVDTSLSATGRIETDQVDWEGLLSSVIDLVNLICGVGDARAMTAEEVKNYQDSDKPDSPDDDTDDFFDDLSEAAQMTTLIMGPRRSGKTTLANGLAEQLSAKLARKVSVVDLDTLWGVETFRGLGPDTLIATATDYSSVERFIAAYDIEFGRVIHIHKVRI